MNIDDVLKNMDSVVGYFWAEEATELYQLASLLPANSLVVEVGCLYGRSTSVLATAVKERNLRFYAVDNFRDGGEKDKIQFKENMRRLGFTNCFALLEMDSVEAAKLFEDKEIDLMHIDSDHLYEPSKKELEAWIPKMKTGGTICVHDYMNTVFVDGIKKAVDESNLKKIVVRNSLGTFQVP